MTTIVSFSLTSLARLSQLRTRHQLRFRSVQPIDFTRKSKMHESVALEILGGERNFSSISSLSYFFSPFLPLFKHRSIPQKEANVFLPPLLRRIFYVRILLKEENRVRKNYSRKLRYSARYFIFSSCLQLIFSITTASTF